MAYTIEYSPETEGHLKALTSRQRAIVLDAVDRRLAEQPTTETRNREPMRPNPIAPWELRIGGLRVYYDVKEAPDMVVLIRAVGIKRRNSVFIGGQEIAL